MEKELLGDCDDHVLRLEFYKLVYKVIDVLLRVLHLYLKVTCHDNLPEWG